MTTFVLYSTSPHATPAVLQATIEAAEAGLVEVVATWAPIATAHGRTPIVAPTFRIARAADDFAAGDIPVLFVPRMPADGSADPGVVAYHYLRNGLPFCIVLATTSDLSELLDRGLHEIVETVTDERCNWYIPAPDGGAPIAAEVCDPGEGVPLTRAGQHFPAWVTPAWFGLGSGACLVRDDGPDLAPGMVAPGNGYAMRDDGSEVRAANFRGHPDRRLHPLSRRSRRRAAVMVGSAA